MSLIWNLNDFDDSANIQTSVVAGKIQKTPNHKHLASAEITGAFAMELKTVSTYAPHPGPPLKSGEGGIIFVFSPPLIEGRAGGVCVSPE